MENKHIDIEIIEQQNIGLGELSFLLLDLDSVYRVFLYASRSQLNEIIARPSRFRTENIPHKDRLEVIGLSKNSPIKISLGSWVPKAIDSFGMFIERMYLLRDKKNAMRLENYGKALEIEKARVQAILDTLKETQPHLSEEERVLTTHRLLDDTRRIYNEYRTIKLLK